MNNTAPVEISQQLAEVFSLQTGEGFGNPASVVTPDPQERTAQAVNWMQALNKESLQQQPTYQQG